MACVRLDMNSIEDYFVIGDKLGQGGFAGVYRATPTERARAEIPDLPEHDVAIKSVKATSRTQKEIIQEIQVLRRLNPPQYTQYYGCFQGMSWPADGSRSYFIDRRVYLITNLVPGDNLYNILESDLELTDAQKQSILKQIASAITHLHNIGIAHLDIKPGNTMVDLSIPEDPSVTVIDYNMSCMLDTMKGSCSGRGGTPRFKDPRVKGYDKESLKLSDWWAFAKIALELYGSVDNIPEPYTELFAIMTDPELQQMERPNPDVISAIYGL